MARPMTIYVESTTIAHEDELDTAHAIFKNTKHVRVTACEDRILEGSLVFARHTSSYWRLEKVVEQCKGRLLNSSEQRAWAKRDQWLPLLKSRMPKTWTIDAWEDLPNNAKYVSKLFEADERAAVRPRLHETKQEALDYIKFVTRGEPGRMRSFVLQEPIPGKRPDFPDCLETEGRTFVIGSELLSGGKRWFLGKAPELEDHVLVSLSTAIKLGGKLTFFAVDFAKTDKGRRVVYDLHEGTNCPLSGLSPWKFYEDLAIWRANTQDIWWMSD